MTDHVNFTRSDRGFKHMPPIRGRVDGESVKVYESSLAKSPHVWLAAEAPMDRNNPGPEKTTAIIELSILNAWRLADQLRALARFHYQGGGLEFDD